MKKPANQNTLSVENLKPKPFRAIDLFCGIGGNSWGAKAAGAEIIAGFDIWPMASRVFRANFPGALLFEGDLASYTEKDIQDTRKKIGEIDLLLASPECTSHSYARGGRPKSTESQALVWVVHRFARVFRSRWVLVENVPAMRNWPGYEAFLEFMLCEGYHVREYIFDASNFGVPQSRKRLYLLFDRASRPPEVNLSERQPLAVAPHICLNGKYTFTPLELPGRSSKTLWRAKEAIKILGKQTPFIIVYYGSGKQWQTLDRPLRTITTRDRFALVRPDGRGGHEMRMLQPDELQTAMGFPPEFDLSPCPTRSGKVHLLGNAVCPPVITAIVKTLIKNE